MQTRFFLSLIIALLGLAPHAGRAASPLLVLKNELVASPAAAPSEFPRLVQSPTGTTSLNWIEREPVCALKFSEWKSAPKQWSPAQVVAQDDGLSLADRPASGPAISTNGQHVSAAWLSVADNSRAVLVGQSHNGGEQFLAAARVDDGKPIGEVAIATLSDGTAFVLWREAGAHYEEEFLLLRRITNDGALSVSARIATLQRAEHAGAAWLGLIKEMDHSAAQLLVAYTASEGGIPHVATRFLTVAPPEPDRNPCSVCPPAEPSGYPVHGYILHVDRKQNLVVLKHDMTNDRLPASGTSFHVVEEELTSMASGGELYGKIEKRGSEWWLYDVRLVLRR